MVSDAEPVCRTPAPPPVAKPCAAPRRQERPARLLGYTLGRGVVRQGFGKGRTHALKRAVDDVRSLTVLQETEERLRELVLSNEAKRRAEAEVQALQSYGALTERARLRHAETRQRKRLAAAEEIDRRGLGVVFHAEPVFLLPRWTSLMWEAHSYSEQVHVTQPRTRAWQRYDMLKLLTTAPLLLPYHEHRSRAHHASEESVLRQYWQCQAEVNSEWLLGAQCLRAVHAELASAQEAFRGDVRRLDGQEEEGRQRCEWDAEAAFAALDSLRDLEGRSRWARDVPTREANSRRNVESCEGRERNVLGIKMSCCLRTVSQAAAYGALLRWEAELRQGIASSEGAQHDCLVLAGRREGAALIAARLTHLPSLRAFLGAEHRQRCHIEADWTTACGTLDSVLHSLRATLAGHETGMATLLREEQDARRGVVIEHAGWMRFFGEKKDVSHTVSLLQAALVQVPVDEGSARAAVEMLEAQDVQQVLVRALQLPLCVIQERRARTRLQREWDSDRFSLQMYKPNVRPALRARQRVMFAESDARELLTGAEQVAYDGWCVQAEGLLRMWEQSWIVQCTTEQGIFAEAESAERVVVVREEVHDFAECCALRCAEGAALAKACEAEHEEAARGHILLLWVQDEEALARQDCATLYRMLWRCVPAMRLASEEAVCRAALQREAHTIAAAHAARHNDRKALTSDQELLGEEILRLYLNSGHLHTLQRWFRVCLASRRAAELRYVRAPNSHTRHSATPAAPLQPETDSIPAIVVQTWARRIESQRTLSRLRYARGGAKRIHLQPADAPRVPFNTPASHDEAARLLQRQWRAWGARRELGARRLARSRGDCPLARPASTLAVPPDRQEDEYLAALVLQRAFRCAAARQEATLRRTARSTSRRHLQPPPLHVPRASRAVCLPPAEAACIAQRFLRCALAKTRVSERRYVLRGGAVVRYPAVCLKTPINTPADDGEAALTVQRWFRMHSARGVAQRKRAAGQQPRREAAPPPADMPVITLMSPDEAAATLRHWCGRLSARRQLAARRYLRKGDLAVPRRTPAPPPGVVIHAPPPLGEEEAAVTLQSWCRLLVARRLAAERRFILRSMPKRAVPAPAIEVSEAHPATAEETGAAVAIQSAAKRHLSRQTLVRKQVAAGRLSAAHQPQRPASLLAVPTPHPTRAAAALALQLWFRTLHAKSVAHELKHIRSRETVKIPAMRLSVPPEPS